MRPTVVLLLALAALTAGCGTVGDGRDADVEESIARAMRADLDAEAPLVQVRSVECRGPRTGLACRVALGVGGEVVQVDYRLLIDGARCWEAQAVRTVVVGAGTETDPLRDMTGASDLQGCLR